jgi:type IV pilus assembly protein PilO
VAIGPQGQREQILTAIAVVALALAGAYWYFIYQDNATVVDKLAMHVDSLDAANQKAKAALAKGSVEQIREEARSFRENLDLMRTLVPAVNEVPTLIDQVSTAARRARLDLAGIEPEPVIEGEMFDTHRFKVKINGAYHDIATVLGNIGSLNRIVAPLNLALALPQGSPKSAPGKQTLAATFEIQTYVVRTAPPKAKPKAAAKAGGDN